MKTKRDHRVALSPAAAAVLRAPPRYEDTIGNAVEAAYRRGDMFEKRRRLMADWAGFLAGWG